MTSWPGRSRSPPSCDVAVVLAGRLSGEAMDVESLLLPGRQAEVVAAVAAANPHTVLVTLSANPVVLPDSLSRPPCCTRGFRASSSLRRWPTC